MKRNLVLITLLLLTGACTTPSNVTSNPTTAPGSVTDPQTGSTTSPTTGNADNLKVQALITQKCAYCHSTTPNSASGYSSPAEGIALDTYAQMVQMSRQIKREVASRQMPERPITMTDEERAMISQWSGTN